jgi:hypothetical protein
LGGLCLETTSGITPSEIQSVRLQLSGSPLTLKVQARWQRFAQLEKAWHTGVQCVGVGAEAVSELGRLVQENAARIMGFLRSESLLGDVLTYDELSDFALCTRERRVRAGNVIWRGGRLREIPGARDSLFVLYSGCVLIEPEGGNAHRICLEQIHPGTLFGGLGLLTELSVPLTTVAADDCVLFEIDGSTFAYLERARPTTAQRLRELIVDRLTSQLAEMIRHVARA